LLLEVVIGTPAEEPAMDLVDGTVTPLTKPQLFESCYICAGTWGLKGKMPAHTTGLTILERPVNY